MTKKKRKAGPMRQATRSKTDVRLSPELMERIEQVCLKLGLTKNAFFLTAAAHLLSVMGPALGMSHDRAAQFLREELGRAAAGT
jgi:hypothetical protein